MCYITVKIGKLKDEQVLVRSGKGAIVSRNHFYGTHLYAVDRLVSTAQLAVRVKLDNYIAL